MRAELAFRDAPDDLSHTVAQVLNALGRALLDGKHDLITGSRGSALAWAKRAKRAMPLLAVKDTTRPEAVRSLLLMIAGEPPTNAATIAACFLFSERRHVLFGLPRLSTLAAMTRISRALLRVEDRGRPDDELIVKAILMSLGMSESDARNAVNAAVATAR